MVEPNTVPLFLLLPFSLNCQLDLITIKVPLLLFLAGTLGLFTTQVLHVFPSQLSCRDVLSADPFSMYLQLPSHMPDTLAPSRMGPGTGTPLEVLPQVQPAAQDTLPLFQGIPVPQEGGMLAQLQEEPQSPSPSTRAPTKHRALPAWNPISWAVPSIVWKFYFLWKLYHSLKSSDFFSSTAKNKAWDKSIWPATAKIQQKAMKRSCHLLCPNIFHFNATEKEQLGEKTAKNKGFSSSSSNSAVCELKGHMMLAF